MPTNVDQYFAYAHLPTKLQDIAQPLAAIAGQLDKKLPDGAEKSAGMRKLLEAKDCFVRAAIDAPKPPPEFNTEDPDQG